MKKSRDKNSSPLKKKRNEAIPKRLTVLPLRDIVIYPYMIFPVLIGRESSLKAVAEALDRDKFIFLAAQKDASIEDPTKEDIYRYGTVAKIIQLLRLPNNLNLMKILVDGVTQGRIKKFYANRECIEAEVEVNAIQTYEEEDAEFQAMVRHAGELFGDYVKMNRNVPPEVMAAYENITDPVRKLYYAAANLQQDVAIKQRILERTALNEQYFELISILTSELEVLQLEQDIDTRVHETIQKAQKRFYVMEQIRALQQELGDDDEAFPELAKIREKIDSSGMKEEVQTKALEEFEKLKKIPVMSPEFGVLRNYLDWLTSVPWSEETPDNLDLDHARTILDEDHYGLDQVKERILEYIAVLNLTHNVRGQVLCFSGPPGVGKTSLARSIARALGRKFVRISLGGVRDEAEIRGHRRTYIGSMPGKIIQSMKRAGTVNPVILLDEVDKMSMDFRGDPSSALLEVLDPEQNHSFNDHYLEVDYDLSKVLFITTANVKYEIPAPLLDRMEAIDLSSYLEHEKIEIARRHILPKQIEKNGLAGYNIRFTEEALQLMVHEYTKEAGVRNLERQIASVLRKLGKNIVREIRDEEKALQTKKITRKKAEVKDPGSEAIATVQKREHVVTAETLHEFLKVPLFRKRRSDLTAQIGVATGLAWTSVGGDILPVEVTIMPGQEKITLTGKLGDVMKESAMAAFSFVRSHASSLGVPEDFYKEREIHLHVPEGAIPKDGPSAGITMTIALISAASRRPVRGDIAMTGEITLRGNILAIGGLNEKLVAAKAAGIRTVLIPKENEIDLQEMNPHITEGLEVIPVSHILEAVPVAIIS